MSSSHQLAAIMFTDIVGYTAMMQQDEKKTVALIKHYNTTLEKSVSQYNGQVLNYYGDGSLCIFPSANDAVNCAIEIQKELKTDPTVPLRIGLHIGEVFFENGKALGDGVNIASRIQSLGLENTILISGEINDKIKNNASITSTSLGHFDFKNVDHSMEVFALTNDGLFVPQRKKLEGKLKQKNTKKRKVIIVIALGLLAVGALIIYTNNYSKKDVSANNKFIAVLPFVNMSNDKNQEYFSDGLSEELLNLLSRVSELKVIGRTSSFSFKGKDEDLRIIGEKLGVGNILEGSVQRDGNKIRVTAQLIRTADGSQLWSEKYDRDMEGIFKIQDEIATAVVKQLKMKLLDVPINASSQTNIEVYNLILQGNYFAGKRDKDNMAKALDYYLNALAIDSLNARCWAAVAKCYNVQASWSWIDQRQGFEKSRESATKAIALDSKQAEGHWVLGAVKYYEFDWHGAEAEIQIALDLERENTDALRAMGNLYRTVGRYDEAIRLFKESITIDPVQAISYFNYGQLLYTAHRLEEAIVAFKKVLGLNPQFPRAHIFLGETYLAQGKPEMALAEMTQEADEAWKTFGLILAYQALGRKKESDGLLSDYITKSPRNWYQKAEIYSFSGQKDRAFECLEKAYKAMEPRLTYLKNDPLLKNLEGDLRLKTFLKKMNLPVD